MTLNKVVAAHVLSSFSVCLTGSITLNIDLDDRAGSPPGTLTLGSLKLKTSLTVSTLNSQL